MTDVLRKIVKSTPDTESPEYEVAAWYMRRKGLSRVPIKRVIRVATYCWYFYYDVDGGELELEVEWDPDSEEWDAKSTAYKVVDDAPGRG